MKPPEAEREEPAGPGAAAKAALRVVDAGLGFFQRLHDRLAGSASRDDRHGHAAERHEPEAAAVPARPSLLRSLAIALLLLLAGAGTGGWLAWRSLSLQLQEHAGVVERMQDELDAMRKEDARNVKLMDRFQRESAEYRHETREAQRQSENAKGRIAELEAQVEAMQREEAKRAELTAQKARRATDSPRTKPSAPQKTGNCAVGSAGDLSNCIEKFNR